MAGTPVDVEIVTRAHAILSASSADRWLTCTPSARIEEAIGDKTSAYATDGTAAHAFAELRLRYLTKQITKPEYLAAYDANKTLHEEPLKEWTVADWDAIDMYVSYVLEEAGRLDAKVYIEQKVDYSKYAQGGFGTSDVVLVSVNQRIIKAIDLKFGKGVPVYAPGNSQARLYTLGALIAHDPKGTGRFDAVEYTIHQPRLDNVSTDGETVTSLLDWAENVVAPAAKLAWEGKGKLVPSDKGCRFCKAAATCRARAAENAKIAMKEFGTVPDVNLDDYLMDMKEVGRILPMIDGWMEWANKFKAYALESARDREKEIPGYKLVRGRSNRIWNNEIADLVAELKALGLAESAIFPPPETPKPRSVAQLEKTVGKAGFRPIEAKLVVKAPGAPTLVPETDPRDAIDKVGEAKKAFEA